MDRKFIYILYNIDTCIIFLCTIQIALSLELRLKMELHCEYYQANGFLYYEILAIVNFTTNSRNSEIEFHVDNPINLTITPVKGLIVQNIVGLQTLLLETGHLKYTQYFAFLRYYYNYRRYILDNKAVIRINTSNKRYYSEQIGRQCELQQIASVSASMYTRQ